MRDSQASSDWAQGPKIEITSEEDYRMFVKRAFPKFALDMIEGPYVIQFSRYKKVKGYDWFTIDYWDGIEGCRDVRQVKATPKMLERYKELVKEYKEKEKEYKEAVRNYD